MFGNIDELRTSPASRSLAVAVASLKRFVRRGRLFDNERRRRARQFRLPLGDQLPKLQDQIAALVIQIMTL